MKSSTSINQIYNASLNILTLFMSLSTEYGTNKTQKLDHDINSQLKIVTNYQM